jgi:hypothetical protein
MVKMTVRSLALTENNSTRITETNSLKFPRSDGRNLFIYWEGPKPPIISLLHEIIYLHGGKHKSYRIISLADENISNYILLPSYYNEFSLQRRMPNAQSLQTN